MRTFLAGAALVAGPVPYGAAVSPLVVDIFVDRPSLEALAESPGRGSGKPSVSPTGRRPKRLR
ncbi:hypothetical protein GCM10027445_67380 [Amycolatopsis endophytica]